MEKLMKVIILDKSNELIESIARGSEPTVRCNPRIQRWARWSLTLRKVSYLDNFYCVDFFKIVLESHYMDYKATGNIRGNTITLETEIPIRGKVTVIIHQETEILTQQRILSFLKEKFSEWRRLYSIEKNGIFGSFARDEQTNESDSDIIIKFSENPKDVFYSKNKIRDTIEEKFEKKVDLANEQYLKPHVREQILKEAIYVFE